MKIRNKIVITFTVLVSFVLLFSFTLVYYLSINYLKQDFYERVKEKANLTAWKYFEQDEMSPSMYAKMLESFIKSLPDAEEIVLDTKYHKLVKDSLDKFLPKDLVQNLFKGKTIKFLMHEKQGVGIYYPDNQGNFIVIITAIDKIGNQQKQKLLKILLLIFFCSIIFIYLLGRLYGTNVLHPISNLLKNIKRIRATNLSLRLKESERNDELAELIHTFNQMLDRLENSFTMQKNFISNASHELKNPLTAILGETEIALSKNRTPNEYIATLNKIMAEGDRLNDLIRNLLSLAQTDVDLSNLKREEIRMDELIWEIKEHFDKTSYKGRIDIHFPILPETPDLITILGIPSLLKIAIINIVDNGCKFSGHLKVDITLKTDDKMILLLVKDNGIGIPGSEMSNLFQPFFRASNALSFKGSGIGLSLVKKIISLHQGTISIYSEPGKGTSVEVAFFRN
jgi:signal transduction histidine kinase